MGRLRANESSHAPRGVLIPARSPHYGERVPLIGDGARGRRSSRGNAGGGGWFSCNASTAIALVTGALVAVALASGRAAEIASAAVAAGGRDAPIAPTNAFPGDAA